MKVILFLCLTVAYLTAGALSANLEEQAVQVTSDAESPVVEWRSEVVVKRKKKRKNKTSGAAQDVSQTEPGYEMLRSGDPHSSDQEDGILHPAEVGGPSDVMWRSEERQVVVRRKKKRKNKTSGAAQDLSQTEPGNEMLRTGDPHSADQEDGILHPADVGGTSDVMWRSEERQVVVKRKKKRKNKTLGAAQDVSQTEPGYEMLRSADSNSADKEDGILHPADVGGPSDAEPTLEEWRSEVVVKRKKKRKNKTSGAAQDVSQTEPGYEMLRTGDPHSADQEDGILHPADVGGPSDAESPVVEWRSEVVVKRKKKRKNKTSGAAQDVSQPEPGFEMLRSGVSNSADKEDGILHPAGVEGPSAAEPTLVEWTSEERQVVRKKKRKNKTSGAAPDASPTDAPFSVDGTGSNVSWWIPVSMTTSDDLFPDTRARFWIPPGQAIKVPVSAKWIMVNVDGTGDYIFYWIY